MVVVVEPRLVQKMIAGHVAAIRSLQNDYAICHLLDSPYLVVNLTLETELLS